jgi:peptidoglycan hydrolase-like protein with peptidoglycan-binding domain
MRAAALLSAAAGLAALVLAATAAGRENPSIAALQVALRARGLYTGDIDGVSGNATVAALRRFQRAARLRPTGIVDVRTRHALGRLGSPLAGQRTMGVDSRGWDVSVLEYELARHGFDPGRIDGSFDLATLKAAQAFRRFAGLPQHCLVEPSTIKTLRTATRPTSPEALAWPVRGPIAARFGVAGDRLHAGIDIASPYGTGVAAAAGGRVAWAGELRGGLGYVVRVVHPRGVQTIYGHLARVDVKPGQQVLRGAWLGLVGRTGTVTSPRLYFEVRVRGAAVDPLTVLRGRRSA